MSQVYVLRVSNDPREFGAVTAWHLDALIAANIVLAARFQLRPNDVVFIEENPVTKWGRTDQADHTWAAIHCGSRGQLERGHFSCVIARAVCIFPGNG